MKFKQAVEETPDLKDSSRTGFQALLRVDKEPRHRRTLPPNRGQRPCGCHAEGKVPGRQPMGLRRRTPARERQGRNGLLD